MGSKNKVKSAIESLQQALRCLEADDGSRASRDLLRRAKGYAENAANILALEIDPDSKYKNPLLMQLASGFDGDT